MNKKFYVLCLFLFVFSVLFRGFSAQQTNPGSGSMNKPLVKFKEWKVGRSDKGTDKDDKVHTSFITSTQTLCRFSASVGYVGGSQPDNTSPIDPATVVWTVVEASHNMTLDTKSVKKNWTGPAPSTFDTSTSFNVVASLTVPKVVGTRTVKGKLVPDYIGSTSCTSDANRSKRKPVHRGGTKMKFKIKFAAQTKAGGKIEKLLSLEADDKDQIRQEYVDYNKPIPTRNDSKWVGENTYDFGHYKTMMDDGLGNYFQSWIDAMNKLYREGKNDEDGNPMQSLTKANFRLNSGYRNPHHNYDHAYATTVLSSHMYGYALDVNGKNIDGVAGADQQKMVTAAETKKRDGGAGARHSQRYSGKTHVHADWAPSDWGDRPKSTDRTKYTAGDPPTFSLPTQTTSTTTSSLTTTTTTPTTTTSSATLSPTDGSYTASAGGTHTSNVSVPSGYWNVYWYVKPSSESGLGTLVYTSTTDGSPGTSATFDYTFASDASGDYVITAYIELWDWVVVEPSYTVSVSGSSTSTPPSTPSTPPSTPSTPPSTPSTPGNGGNSGDSSSGGSIGPASGYSDTGTAGQSYAVKLTSSSALSTVLWYIQSPGDTSASLWNTKNYYDGVTTESTFYWYFYDNVSGDYEFTAEVTPWTGDSYSTSFTVSVTVP